MHVKWASSPADGLKAVEKFLVTDGEKHKFTAILVVGFECSLRLARENKPVTIPDVQAFKRKGGTQMEEQLIGKVSDFFARPVVAAFELTADLKVGDKIHITGHTTNLEMIVDSMQINNVNVQQAKAGDSVGIKVSDRVRKGDSVYKVTG